jgi:hypothetical protein
MNDKTWSTPVGIFVPAERVFPGIHSTADELKKQLSRLSRTDGLILCAKLNLIISSSAYQTPLEKQQIAIQAVFSQEEKE